MTATRPALSTYKTQILHESPQVKTAECKQVKTQAMEDMERDGIFPATGDVDRDEEEEEELPEGAQ